MSNLDYIYDLEVYPNFFSAAFEHAASDRTWYFELSAERNDINEFVEFIYQLRNLNARMVGFNSIGFDYPIVHMIVINHCGGQITNQVIFNKCDAIINGGWDNRFAHVVWESDWIVEQVDLYKIHHFDNVSRATSLKVLEFNMRSHNIEDLPFPPGIDVPLHGFPIVRHYNKHDVSETKKFYFHSLDKIKMREELTEKYNKNFINHNDTKIGKDYFIMKLEERIPGSCYERGPDGKKPRQTVRASIPLAGVIFPYIKFEQPEFNRILNYFKSQNITETKGVFNKLHCTVDGFDYHFGVGGIHGSVDSQIVEADDEYMLLDVDVKSYYPNIAIKNRLYPEHLSEQFCDIYQDIYEQRLATLKKSIENALFKLALNGVFGDTNNKYSPFYDPAYTMAITINGQLLLCMLAEQLIKIDGSSVVQINTDGITVRVPRVNEQYVNSICQWWENFTCLELENVEYSRMFIRDCNNYIGEYTDGKLKRKGAYMSETVLDDPNTRELDWSKNHSAIVVAKATEAVLVRGEDVTTFIAGHNDYMDFMLRAKVPRSSRLVGVDHAGNDQPLQNITRYYVTHQGVELVKIMPPLSRKPDLWRRIGIDVGWKVAPCNNLSDVRLPINYDYYIEKANKLITKLQADN